MSLAARGSRNLDAGEEDIESPRERSQVRRQARKVYFQSGFAAVVLTGLGLILPV